MSKPFLTDFKLLDDDADAIRHFLCMQTESKSAIYYRRLHDYKELIYEDSMSVFAIPNGCMKDMECTRNETSWKLKLEKLN